MLKHNDVPYLPMGQDKDDYYKLDLRLNNGTWLDDEYFDNYILE